MSEKDWIKRARANIEYARNTNISGFALDYLIASVRAVIEGLSDEREAVAEAACNYDEREATLHELSQIVDRQDEQIDELERENEQLRERDIRNYIPHPNKWPKNATSIDITALDLSGTATLINVFSREEARRLHEGNTD